MTSRKTIKYELDPEKTLPYFLDHIKCGKVLSERIVKKVNFLKGSFYTILPSSAELERLFDFNFGGIIPPVPCGKEGYFIEGHSETFYPNKVITMDLECSELVSEFLKKNNKNLAVVENYNLDPDSPFVKIENVSMIPYYSDVYYFLNKKNSAKEIYDTIRKSNQVWHFLTVLTRLTGTIPTILTDEIIDQLCENAVTVIAGAYDGEGYIFWEKTTS